MANMVVEFFGMPGAGKSHLCRLVSAELRDRGWRVQQDTVAEDPIRLRRLMRKLLPALWEWVRSPESRGIVWSILPIRECGFVATMRLSFNWLYVRARARVANSMGDGFCTMDQGCAQALWSEAWALPASRATRSWSEATAGLGMPLVVVDVRVSADVAGARTLARNTLNSPLDGRRQDEGKLERALLVTETIRRRLVSGDEGCPLMLRTNGEGGEETVRELVSKLEMSISALAPPMDALHR